MKKHFLYRQKERSVYLRIPPETVVLRLLSRGISVDWEKTSVTARTEREEASSLSLRSCANFFCFLCRFAMSPFAHFLLPTLFTDCSLIANESSPPLFCTDTYDTCMMTSTYAYRVTERNALSLWPWGEEEEVANKCSATSCTPLSA